MKQKTSNGFIHSVPVPRIYKTAAKLARQTREGVDSLKNLLYNEKHSNLKALYKLTIEMFKREEIITRLIEESGLLTEARIDIWLAKILICELLWGPNKMKRGSKPIETILKYEEKFRELLPTCDKPAKNVFKHSISKPRYARINTLKISVDEAIEKFIEEGWTLLPLGKKSNYKDFIKMVNNLQPSEFMVDFHIPDLLIFPPKTEFFSHPAYKTGNIILQDKASCLPVHLLNPDPGSTVIDMCAAPGMKTTQLAAMLKNNGTVYAVELNPNRGKLLREFAESAGATCVKSMLKDVMQVTNKDCPGIDYVLVDPSCSGSGITDRMEVQNYNLTDKVERLRKLSNFQSKLLRHAFNVFPQAKRIVYSTCSINAEENEDVVRQVLETARYYKLIDARKLLKSWNETSSVVFPEMGNMCVYATPENDRTNGFFVAVFERLKEGERNPFLNVQLCKMYAKNKSDIKSDEYIENTLEQRHEQLNQEHSTEIEAYQIKNNKKRKYQNDTNDVKNESTEVAFEFKKKKIDDSNVSETFDSKEAIKKIKIENEILTIPNDVKKENNEKVEQNKAVDLDVKKIKKEMKKDQIDITYENDETETSINNLNIRKIKKEKNKPYTLEAEEFNGNLDSTEIKKEKNENDRKSRKSVKLEPESGNEGENTKKKKSRKFITCVDDSLIQNDNIESKLERIQKFSTESQDIESIKKKKRKIRNDENENSTNKLDTSNVEKKSKKSKLTNIEEESEVKGKIKRRKSEKFCHKENSIEQNYAVEISEENSEVSKKLKKKKKDKTDKADEEVHHIENSKKLNDVDVTNEDSEVSKKHKKKKDKTDKEDEKFDHTENSTMLNNVEVSNENSEVWKKQKKKKKDKAHIEDEDISHIENSTKQTDVEVSIENPEVSKKHKKKKKDKTEIKDETFCHTENFTKQNDVEVSNENSELSKKHKKKRDKVYIEDQLTEENSNGNEIVKKQRNRRSDIEKENEETDNVEVVPLENDGKKKKKRKSEKLETENECVDEKIEKKRKRLTIHDVSTQNSSSEKKKDRKISL